MRICALVRGCVLATLASTSPNATAERVVFHYTAVGTEGAEVVGTFGYDDGVPDADSVADGGFYPRSGFLTARVRGGVQDGLTVEQTGISWAVSTFEFEHSLESMEAQHTLTLVDTNATALASDRLPTRLTLSNFDIHTLLLVSKTKETYLLTAIRRP